jgi:hypothetical protein
VVCKKRQGQWPEDYGQPGDFNKKVACDVHGASNKGLHYHTMPADKKSTYIGRRP